jgi:hypothetical protein
VCQKAASLKAFFVGAERPRPRRDVLRVLTAQENC